MKATSVAFRDDHPIFPERPNIVRFDLPGPRHDRACLEAEFDPARPVDAWARQMLGAAAQVAALLLEIERAHGRWPLSCARSRTDGAAPLIGSSEAIRRVRARIEHVAATDFTVLMEGGIGPEPHRDFIEVSGDAAFGWRQEGGRGKGLDA